MKTDLTGYPRVVRPRTLGIFSRIVSVADGFDAGIRLAESVPRDMIAVSLGPAQRFAVVGAPAYFERAGIPTTPMELNGHSAVIYTQDPGGTDTWSFRQGESEVSVSISGRLRVSEGVRAAVLGGLGLAIVPRWMFAPELAHGAVRTVLADWSLPAGDIWAVFPTGRKASAKARAFTKFVETELRKPYFAYDSVRPAVGRRPFLLPSAPQFSYRFPAAECATWAALIPSKARPYPIPSSMIRLSF